MDGDPRIHVTLEQLRRLEGPARGLSFLPRQPSGSVLNGRHASRLRGRGLNFEEMRDYLPGDDIRSIDWKATARTGSPYVRVFTEERDRPALLVVDQRMTMFFGSELNMKSVTAAEAAALTSFRVLEAGDRVGGIVFDDDGQVELRPQRSRRAVHRLLETVTARNAALTADREVQRRPGALNSVLKSISRIAHHDHLVFVFSDFDGIDEQTHRHLKSVALHNDLILVLVYDPIAIRLRKSGRAVVGDHSLQAELDLGSSSTRSALEAYSNARLDRIRDWQAEINLSVLPLSAGLETLPQVRQLLGRYGGARRAR
ncbi:MAG: DUF58 domain-containing protein [Woeseiaceae bacterium]|nr:DUF58 domain-containing protein [Woeseiaceae bacterium]